MPWNIENSLPEVSDVTEQIRKRVTDHPNRTFSKREIDQLSERFLFSDNISLIPYVVPGQLMLSSLMEKALKDARFITGVQNKQATVLEDRIFALSRYVTDAIEELQREAKIINSQISEQEIRMNEGYTKVHFNNFVDQIDQHDFDTTWNTDPKTQLPFLPMDVAEIQNFTGATLATKNKTRAGVVDVILIGEETDVGDSKTIVMKTSPRNMLRPNGVFRYVIARRDHDSSSRKYKRDISYCTLLVELGNTQIVNMLELKPLGQRHLSIEEVSYISEDQNEIALNTVDVSAETSITLLLEPVKTKYLKVKLKQHAPVTRGFNSIEDRERREINQALQGLGFTTLLGSKVEEIQGRFFDFSIKELNLFFLEYQPVGRFNAPPLQVDNLLGLSMINSADAIKITSLQRAYGEESFLPSGQVLVEQYAGVELRNGEEQTVFRKLLPVPDSYPIQYEALPILNRQGLLKLYPDLIWNVDSNIVQEVVPFLDWIHIITENPHELSAGDLFYIYGGPGDLGLKGAFTVDSVVDQYTIRLDGAFSISAVLVTEATYPKVKLYKGNTETITAQEPPLRIYKESAELTIGTDFHVSPNGGSTWLTSWPSGAEALKYQEVATAGRFKIRILRPDYSRVYWAEYRILAKQKLEPEGIAMLSNGKVVFQQRLARNTTASISSQIILRSETRNPLVTPVVFFYVLKVRSST